MTRVYKFEVPVDYRNHVLPLTVLDKIVHVDIPIGAPPDVVNVWAEVEPGRDPLLTERLLREDGPRVFRVFGTGDPLIAGSHHRGTVVTSNRLVWHLYEVRS